MAKRKATKRKGGKTSLLSVIIMIIAVIAVGFFGGDTDTNPTGNSYTDGEVYVHFVDVGQGSATLIQDGSVGILIDAGESDYGDTLADYINSCGVDYLEYVVASHPHSDHIGGMLDVLKAFPVGKVIMPELEDFNTPTTRVYENLLSYLIEAGIDTEFVSNTEAYGIGLNDSIDLEILGPVEQVEDLNNMSLICRVRAVNTTFMLLADAEKQELSSVYESPLNSTATVFDTDSLFKSDIIAMGHHGSRTSIHKPFLNAVDAEVAVISCGRDNSYGHPHEEALEYISDNAMTLYRTDEMGSIVFKCTAEGYEVVS